MSAVGGTSPMTSDTVIELPSKLSSVSKHPSLAFNSSSGPSVGALKGWILLLVTRDRISWCVDGTLFVVDNDVFEWYDGDTAYWYDG